ncbi:splicing factor 3A subunit 3 [Drosophila subpulchrella]|uniref:splicing factor 3A subunit 3 n=1 Tax=Drosophila subpulchrella TaxID=1486046 RepID=UPI0018A152BA|nr:splicing factor 3A subunit 3 [Drosophila subpulchrella]
METLLEQQRRYHEERERLVKLMVDEHATKKPGEKERIHSEHRLKYLMELHHNATSQLRDLYEDKDNERKAEIAALSGPNEFNEFYARLKQIKQFYKSHPAEVSVPLSVEFDEMIRVYNNPDDMSALVEFTDEEGGGRYLDLNECYELYLNLRAVEKLDYINYLMSFDHVFDIPRERKNREYRKYIETLNDYLHHFILRIQPLLDLEGELLKVELDFQRQWLLGTFPGFSLKETESALANTGAHLDLSAFSSWEELASLGLDRLKSALVALGLKCGGTLEERAQRLFSTKGKSTLDPALMAKKPSAKTASAQSREHERHKEIAQLEALLYKYAELLSEQRAATKENVQRKQARTGGERDDSDVEASESDNDDDPDADDMPYNPKNLPLGWDGKPIPYWLYKLHGLNISYNCEICGNFTYKGPKAFQRHFAEWRHAHGMRCLGIPNTAHFANVTQIEDAITLWEKLKSQKQSERWIADQEEEFEDSLGNVVNRKTFEDLKRQGLL